LILVSSLAKPTLVVSTFHLVHFVHYVRCYDHSMDITHASIARANSQVTGVGVLDKSVRILDALESGPLALMDLVVATEIPRPTAHRLAVALETHRLLARDEEGRFTIGPRVSELGSEDRLKAIAQPPLDLLRDRSAESVQLFRRVSNNRICIAVADRASGLRDTVPLGARLPMTAGSAAQVLLAFAQIGAHRDREAEKAVGHYSALLPNTVFNLATLARVQQQGWAQSVAEREPGVASLSVPVLGHQRQLVAALSLSGPRERLGAESALSHIPQLRDAADEISLRAYGQS
jgi:DNA-binding IclR family transcriptional regulator